MSQPTAVYLIPYAVSFLISAGVGVYAFSRRQVVGALPFALFAWAEASWTAGYIAELLANSLETKLFWDNVQFFSTTAVPLGLLAFSLDYTGHKLTYGKHLWASLIVTTVVLQGIVFVFPQHDWVRPAVWLVDDEPFSALVYDFGLVAWLFSGYAYAIAAAGIAPLISHFFTSQRVYRVQIGLILLGVFVPLVGTVITLLDITFTVHRDMSPFTFAVGNLIIAWALFRYHLFDLVPVARNLVVDSMSDLVIVLDAQARVVDLNLAAQHVLRRSASAVIGMPAQALFAEWPDLVERFRDVNQVHTEITATVDGVDRYFDIRLSSLRDQVRNLSGRILVVRDITQRRLAEQELAHYRTHLEELVEQRTAELLAARMALSDERQRLAAELHDSVTQTVFAANTIVELLPRVQQRDPAKAEQYRVELRQLTRGAMAELRALMIELHPGALAKTELGVLIRHLCDVFTGNTRVEVIFHAPQKLFLPEPLQVAFYRVAQQALNNIAKHAKATEVRVQLSQQDRRVELCVADNGPGFDPQTISPDQIGIQSMQSHAHDSGADLSISSQDGEGTVVRLVGMVGNVSESDSNYTRR